MSKVVSLKAAHTPEPWTLGKQADAINKHFDTASRGETVRDGARLAAGLALIDARAMVLKELGKGQWGKWCDENIERSRFDIFKVMKIAGCEDAEAALLEEREKRALGMRAARAAPPLAPNVAHVGNIATLVEAYRELSVEQRAQFRAEIDKVDGE